MPIDTRSDFAALMTKADDLLARVDKRASKVAKSTSATAVLDDLTARVEQTSLDAQVALQKLAAEREAKLARRADKVKIAQHIAAIGAKLLEA